MESDLFFSGIRPQYSSKAVWKAEESVVQRIQLADSMWGELHLISVQDACIKKDLFHFLKDNGWMEEDDSLRIY